MTNAPFSGALSPAKYAAALLLIVACSPSINSATAAEVDATWNTGAVGDWSDGSNWDTDPIYPDNLVDTYNVFISDGEATLDGVFTIDDFTLTGGSLVGSGELNVDGTFTWTGVPGFEEISALGNDGAGAVLNFNGDAILDGGFKQFAAVTLNFNGNTTWVNGNIISIEPPEGGGANNSGTFDIQGDVLWQWNATAAPVFNNLAGGVVKRTTGAGLADIWAAFNNDGELQVESGTLQLAGGGTSGGTFTVAADTTLRISDFNEGFGFAGAPITLLTADSIIESDGALVFGNYFGNATTQIHGKVDSAVLISDPGEWGTVTFFSDSFYGMTSPGTFEAVTGTTSFESSATYMSDLTVQDGATVNASGFLGVSGDVSVFGSGVINLDGTTMNFSTTGTKVITGDGEVVLNNTSEITSNGRLLIDTNVKISGKGSIRAAVAGPLNGFNEGTIQSDAGGTFFIYDLDNAGSISTSDGTSLEYEDQFNSFTNTGTIEVTGGGQLRTRNMVNQADVTINGGLLRLDGPNWSNNGGTITATNATIDLRDSYTFADVGTIVRTNTELAVGDFSTLNNTGQTLNLNNSTGQQGTWTMRGGTILGGSVQSSGGATLLFPATGSSRFGVLDGVTLNTGPTMGNTSIMIISNGLTLNGATIDLSNGNTGAANMTFGSGTRTLSGTGTVILGNSSSAGVNASFGGGNTTIGPNILIRGQTGFVGRVTNQGTVSADVNGGAVAFRDSTNDVGGKLEAKNGGILRLENDWDNNGLIDVQTGSTVWMLGNNVTADIGTIQRAANSTVRLSDTLTNTGDTLDVQADIGGDLELRQAIIVGGTISSSGAGRLLVDNGIVGSRLDGVTLSADVGFTNATSVSTGVLTITNGITLAGATIDVQNNIAPEINFSGTASQTVGGTGEIVVRANGGSNGILNRSTNGAVVTFGPDVTIRVGASSLFQSVTVDGKTNNAAGGFVNQGTIIFENGQQNMVDLRNEGTIYVDAEPNTNHLQLFNSQNETVFVQTAGEFIVDGMVIAQTDMEIRGGEITGTAGQVLFTPGTPKKLVAKTGGTIAVGGGNGFTVDGDVVFGDGGRFEATLSGATNTGSLSIVRGQFQSANGDLNLNTANDYLDIVNLGGIVPGQNYLIAQTVGTVHGQFNTVTPGFEVVYLGNRIFVKTAETADFNLDGFTDGIDFLAWQRGLGITSGATLADGDANRDGAVDQLDLAIWEAQYGFQPLLGLQAPTTSVPEPSALLLGLIGGLALMRHGRNWRP